MDGSLPHRNNLVVQNYINIYYSFIVWVLKIASHYHHNFNLTICLQEFISSPSLFKILRQEGRTSHCLSFEPNKSFQEGLAKVAPCPVGEEGSLRIVLWTCSITQIYCLFCVLFFTVSRIKDLIWARPGSRCTGFKLRPLVKKKLALQAASFTF